MRLTDEIKYTKEYTDLTATLGNGRSRKPILVSGLCEGAEYSFAVSLVTEHKATGCLLIMPDEKRASKMLSVLQSYGINARGYLYRDMVFRNIPSSHESEYERLNTLIALLNSDVDAIVTTSDAALQYTIPPELLDSRSVHITPESEYDINAITEYLEKNRYRYTEAVDGVGQYSRRGGIIDIFAPGSDNPIRIDFFGDSIDSMRYFDVISQRAIENCNEFYLSPCREVMQSDAGDEDIALAIRSRLRYVKNEVTEKKLREELDAVTSGRELYSADKYISVIYPQKACLLDYCDGMLVTVFDYSAMMKRQQTKDTLEVELITDMLSKGEISPKYAEYSGLFPKLDDFIFSGCSVITNNLGGSMVGKRFSGIYAFNTRATVSYGGNYDLLLDDVKGYTAAGYRVKIITESSQAAENTARRLEEDGIHSYVDNGEEQPPHCAVTLSGQDIPGFDIPERRFVLLHAAESSVIIRNKGVQRRKQKKDRNLQRLMSYTELEPGDYVVHAIQGIGIYKGIKSIDYDGIVTDYLSIQYAGGDILYVPCTDLEDITKHIGASSENGTLRLSKLGGGDFSRAKGRAKQSAKDIAKELIQLYAERLRRPGYAFPPDDDMQHSFEEAFEYIETDSQLSAVEDIKRDMEKPYPMDRLLCGDVGYGKTEVALRAAFKCAEYGKQAAILVPTTILALQHYKTLLSRMRGFPINVDMVSRFRSSKENAEALRRVRRGETDIIVGTHRLLSQDVEFKDLGLLIVDEEQLFGVEHKEKLKRFSQNVDVLTLSATPIPRTLNMAISGIRDISLLEEAPGDRYPVQTFVTEYDDDVISEALSRELRRGGQVFYLCNRIERMDAAAKKLRELEPDAVVVTANGQMDKDDLSEIWDEMIKGEIDILVSTTIVEAGVDVPNANTLIIEHSENFGLSQLHQLRGRVGRSSRRAYAYFTYPKSKELSDVAEKRLAAIRDFTEFGAGFRIAMRDMEIRGAGDLLGSQQHGHMDTIGYDLFMKLLNEAVLEEKGNEIKPKTECRINLLLSAFIPEYFIKSTNQRIDAYKKISLIETKEDLYDVTDELSDRFGDIPEDTMNLLKIAYLRSLGAKCGISAIDRKGNDLVFSMHNFELQRAAGIAAGSDGKATIKMNDGMTVVLRCTKDKYLGEATLMLEKYLKNADNKKSEQ